MEPSKEEFLPMLQGVKLSKTQCPTTAEDREKMKDVPYASAIGSIMYAMLCTDTSILHHAFISIFIALWVVITHYVTTLMPILSYFTRFT